jgi:hypothetical protein
MSKEVIGYGAFVPFHVLSCTDITSSDKLVYAVISGLSSERGWCWASNETIAKKVCLKKDSVSKIISKLVEKKFLKRREIRNEKGEVVERRLSMNHIIAPTLSDFDDNPIGLKSDTSSIELRVSVEDEIEVSKNIKKENIKRKKAATEFVPPTIEMVKVFFRENGYSHQAAENAFHHYADKSWCDTYGNRVLNWKSKIRNNWFKDQYKLSESQISSDMDNPEQYEGFNKYRHYNEDVLKQLVDGIWHYQTRPIGFKKG